MFEKMMPGKKYLFIISYTDRSNKSGIHWWSILNISLRSDLLLFESFGRSGIKRFIVTDDKTIVVKVPKGLKLTDRKDDKLTLIKLKFSMNGYKNLTQKEIFNLSSTVHDFFYLIYSFGKNENITNFVTKNYKTNKKLINIALETVINELSTLNWENNKDK